MVDNVTLYGIATLVAGVLGVCIRYSFKSKCSDVGLCCGLIHIEQDIEMEIKAEQQELEAGESIAPSLKPDVHVSQRI